MTRHALTLSIPGRYVLIPHSGKAKYSFDPIKPDPELRQAVVAPVKPAPKPWCAQCERLVHEGSLDDERAIHARFAEQRLRGEWFEMSEGLFEHISQIVWVTGYLCVEEGCPAPQWVKVGLRAMADGASKPLPAELAALV